VCPLISINLLVGLEIFKLFWNQRIEERVPFFENVFWIFLGIFLKYFSDIFFENIFVIFFFLFLGAFWLVWFDLCKAG
jgi:hypothetical protein